MFYGSNISQISAILVIDRILLHLLLCHDKDTCCRKQFVIIHTLMGKGLCGVPLVASLQSNTQISQRNHHGWKNGVCATIQDENEEGFNLIKCYNVHKNQPISTLTPQCISWKILQSNFVVPTSNCIIPIFSFHAITTRVMQRKSMLNSAFLRTW